ncbi:hypothetical protein UQW22_10405 [Isoptericola halotolerans]|uniref:hypothetical protein n=1 Tax=Isoptericola halotolerans TaxID=300560 RepID=UPI00388F36E9
MLRDLSLLDGIALALASAAAMTVGNLLRVRGVHSVEEQARAGVGGTPSKSLVRDPTWAAGALLLVVAILLQVSALVVAPLVVVQPVTVSALVFSTLLTAVVTKRPPTARAVRAILLCVVGVAAFVAVAARVGTEPVGRAVDLVAVLVVFVGALGVAVVVHLIDRRRSMPPLVWVVLGGTFAAFVAVLGKTVILQVQSPSIAMNLSWNVTNTLTMACIMGIGVAVASAFHFARRAYVSNRSDVALAGLTIVEPAVAVALGAAVLHEAAGAPAWAVAAFLGSGTVAVGGVIALSRSTEVGEPSRAGV